MNRRKKGCKKAADCISFPFSPFNLLCCLICFGCFFFLFLLLSQVFTYKYFDSLTSAVNFIMWWRNSKMLSRCTSAITVLVSPSSMKVTLFIHETVRLIDQISQRRQSQCGVCHISPVSRWGLFFCSFV